MDTNLLKSKKDLHTLLCGVSFFILFAFSCAQNKNLKNINYQSVNGNWRVDSVCFKKEKNLYIKNIDVDFKFNSNLILANKINDSIGFCYYHSVEKPHTISLLIYFSMYQLKFPYIYQVNSKEAIKYFKNRNCNTLKFKILKFENENKSISELKMLFLKLTDTYTFILNNEQLILESSELLIYTHKTAPN